MDALLLGSEEFSVDEHPRAVTLDGLLKLPTVFKKDGTVTAGNASVTNSVFSLSLCLTNVVGGEWRVRCL